MRDHSFHIELSREDALSALLEHAEWSQRTELVGLSDAYGRVTADDLFARTDVPNALSSVMDGIAVHYDDFSAGIPDISSWKLGQDFGWANTGCAMPEGFDTAIPIEQVRFARDPVPGEGDPGIVEILEAPRQRGACCREAGAEYRRGALLMPARTRLTPTKVAALAMCGIAEASVICRPRVAFIPTGTELVPAGAPLPRGKAYECNGMLLAGKLRLWGAEPAIMGCVPDELSAITEALLRAAASSDIVVICGGSSKGEHDYTMEALEELGQVLCHETNHGPGKHTSAAVIGKTPVLGLSGPPGGFEITADWYLKPLVDAFLLGHPKPALKVKARLTAPEKNGTPHGKGARTGFRGFGEAGSDFFAIRPVRVTLEDGMPVAAPVTGGPHPDLVKLDEADGYLEVHPSQMRSLKPGDTVEIELRYPYGAL